MTTLQQDAAAVTVPASGELSQVRGEDVLRFCERVRFSGTLGFQSSDARGVMPILNGVPEIAGDDKTLEAALDEFLALDHGTYALTQMLPTLPGATFDGELKLRGSLEAQSPAGLLRYCEGAGLTGLLTLRRDERNYVARYERGELQSVTVDDEADADLSKVFAWDRGIFEIVARSVFERERKSTQPTEPLLKTLEIALTKIMDQSERSAASVRPQAQPLARPSMLRGATQPFGIERTPGAPLRPASVPPASRPRSVAPPPVVETTVKVYLVDKSGPRGPSQTQHAAAALGREVIALEPPSQKHAALSGSAEAPTPAPAPPGGETAGTAARTHSKAWTALFAGIVVATAASALVMIASLVR